MENPNYEVIVFELVRQTIGHLTLDTTSKYVKELSDQERQRRILEIDTQNEIPK